MTMQQILTDREANALNANALPKEQERISHLLAILDARPTAVQIRCVLTRIGTDGKRLELSEPHIVTQKGTQAVISILGMATANPSK
jgi:type II secretory pathway component GspD/PulD (secretin)